MLTRLDKRIKKWSIVVAQQDLCLFDYRSMRSRAT